MGSGVYDPSVGFPLCNAVVLKVWTSHRSTLINWELVRKEDSQVTSDWLSNRFWAWLPEVRAFPSCPWDSGALWGLAPIALPDSLLCECSGVVRPAAVAGSEPSERLETNLRVKTNNSARLEMIWIQIHTSESGICLPCLITGKDEKILRDLRLGAPLALPTRFIFGSVLGTVGTHSVDLFLVYFFSFVCIFSNVPP